MLSDEWNEQQQIYRLKETSRAEFAQKATLFRRSFGKFLKNGRENFTDLALQSPNFETQFFYGLLGSLAYFANVNSMETVLAFVDLVKQNRFESPAETLKGVLTKRGIDLDNSIIALLVK